MTRIKPTRKPIQGYLISKILQPNSPQITAYYVKKKIKSHGLHNSRYTKNQDEIVMVWSKEVTNSPSSHHYTR